MSEWLNNNRELSNESNILLQPELERVRRNFEILLFKSIILITFLLLFHYSIFFCCLYIFIFSIVLFNLAFCRFSFQLMLLLLNETMKLFFIHYEISLFFGLFFIVSFLIDDEMMCELFVSFSISFFVVLMLIYWWHCRIKIEITIKIYFL